jgi:TonB family protein
MHALIHAFATLLVQNPPAEPAAKILPGMTPPKLVKHVERSYSAEARQVRLQGMVELQIVVNADGIPLKFTVTKGLGLGLDEEAITAVKQWRFQPGLKDGRPVPVIAAIQVHFRMGAEHAAPWQLSRTTFDMPAGADRPHLIRSEFPKGKPADHGTVAITFTVDEHGQRKDLNVDKSDSALEQELIAAVQQWRFKPATKDGAPIAVPAYLEFVALRVL